MLVTVAEWSGEPVPHPVDGRMAGSIPVAARTRDPPHHRGFGERETISICGCEMACVIAYILLMGHGRKLAAEHTRMKMPMIII